MRIIVLGSTGLLGQAVVKNSKLNGIETLEVSRTGAVPWDYFRSSLGDLDKRINISTSDVLVNCVGWIPQKSSGDSGLDESMAKALNIDLIRNLQSIQDAKGFEWIQILTDCVFSGKEGHYSESSIADPIDLYGETKARGELLMPGAMKIRSSIVGQDHIGRGGLYEWFKNLPLTSQVEGYTNRHWNGVSTTAFAKLSIGLSRRGLVKASTRHWLPGDTVTKFELLDIFRSAIPRDDVLLVPKALGEASDRTITSLDQVGNQQLWEVAGYAAVPTIKELVREFVDLDRREGALWQSKQK